jgi:protein arginine kinase
MDPDSRAQSPLDPCAMPAWAEGGGPDGDVILATGVWVARNVEGLFFPAKADEATRESVVEIAQRAAARWNEQGEELLVYRMSELGDLVKQVLVETHVSSREHAQQRGAALALTADRGLSVLVHAEDHFRFQCALAGASVREAWQQTEPLVATFAGETRFAVREDLGYLTAAPSNAGAGVGVWLRADAPALWRLGGLAQALERPGNPRVDMQSPQGRAGQPVGGLMELRSRGPYRQSAEQVVADMERLAAGLVEAEREARRGVQTQRKREAVDWVWRAHALLRSARMLKTSEALEHLSTLRLGVALGIVKGLDARALGHLGVMVGPAYVQAKAGKILDTGARDYLRAGLVRRALGGK